MILWTVAPSTVILAQPVTVPPLGAPTFQTTDFDPYFAAANQSSSETGWEQTVAQAKAVLAAQWEIQAETQIQGHLAGISTSDAFNTVTEYRDYLRKELEIQKQSSRSQWELAAEVSIASNRDTFLTALVNRQYDQTTQQGQSYVSAGNAAADAGVQSQIDAARQQFEATFNAGVNQSLNEYNVALAQIQAEAEAFLIELQQADQQFQANLQAIEVYETNVRTGIQGASTQLRNQLNTNGMFYVQNCDAQNQCTADMGQMTAAGQTLQTLLASIDNGLATNVPLSTLATQLTTYLQNRETAATTERDTWDAAIYENRTGSNAQRLGYGLDYAAYQANDPIVHGVLQYLRFGSTAELTGLLGSGHRTAQDFSGVELLGWSVAHIPYPVTANSFRKNQRWVADGVGESALTYDAVGCGGPPPICLTNPFAPFGVNGWGEQFVDVQYSYRMYDPNAENNRDVWQQYAGDINLEYTAWNGTLLPALQSWETQVAQYEANYSAWQTQRAAVEQQNLQAFQQKRDAILTDRNQYLSRVQAAYRDGLAQFGNLEKQLAAEATAAAAESAKNSTANGATASGGVNANFILQNGLQNAAGYTRALGNPRNAARILEAANSRVTAQVDGSFLERGQISGPNLELPRDLLSSFNKTLNGTFGIAVVEQQNQDAKDAQKQATSDLVAMLNKLTADTSVSDRELHASLVGMMDYKITEDTDIMSIELDWEKLEVKDQAEFDKLKENVRKSIEDSKKRKQFKSVELQDDGRIKITRDVSTGSSVLRAGGDALNAEDYVQVMREDTFYVEGSGALKLATTPGLFSAEFDVNETIHNFEASRAEFEQGIQKLFGDTNNRVEAENSAMEALHRRGKQDAQAQAELANQMVDLAKSLIMGGTVASWIQGQINGKVSALIEEATGLPAGFISGMLGGMKPHQALQSYVEGQMYAAIDTAFGLPAGVFSHLASQHKAEQKRKNDPNRKMMRDMVNFYTGAWIPGNPLKGQLNKLADKVGDYAQKNPMVIDAIGMATGTYWMTKAVQGGYKGGALGAGAELVSGGLTAAGIVFTAGTVDANVSYTYEDGWAGDVSVGVGVAPFRASAGVGYSDKGGLSANLGVTAGFGSSGLALGVNWSENEGFGGFAGVTLADGAVSLGVGYSKREGFGGFVGAGDLQVSYSERAGFGAGLSMAHQSSGVGLDFKITEKLGTTVGMNYGQSVGNGASVSGGVSYNTQTGMSANMNVSVDPSAAGFADESDMAGKFQGNGNTVNMGMSWSEEDGLGVSGPSASRQYITSLDGLQSTVAGQARALRAAALLKDEAAYLNSLDKNITEKEWLAMPEEQRQAIRDANKDRTSNERFGNLTDAEQKGRGLEAREGFFSQAGGMVSDSLLSVIGTNSSQAGYVDEAGKFVPRVGNAPTGTGFSLATTWEKTKNFITFNGFRCGDRIGTNCC
ncbi:MAG: TIGR04388 family protein [Leptospirales bacterium]